MKKKIEFKKALIISFIVIALSSICFGLLNYFEYMKYTQNFNMKINGICIKVLEKYPQIDKNELMEILNSKNNSSNVLKEYGINLQKDNVLLENEKEFRNFQKINIIYIVIVCLCLMLIFIIYNSNKDRKLRKITEYIEEINRKNYKLDIDSNSEDELSILQNEIYKTTILLKEQAENSLSDKISLKNSISDISHQLKTPLTSITILLDNIIGNSDMDVNTRHEFISDIRREIVNINFLVQALLKLSKFDANAVEFIEKEVKLSKIIDSAIKNVMPLCDLQKVEINIEVNESDTLLCDEKWQVEAISNILKNSVEYSNSGGTILVRAQKYKLYTQIDIKDNGKGIEKEEIPHIFERFYKGKNSSKNSIGIGLALSKTIIEKNNGNISVESKVGEGTRFVIKYF
ncbi:MAG: HAMP domain-containing sensor histidine kinase [Clostridia bacterium]|nr:HAMP domain-containing sensor histidine kinase [Clostridia bacterium]